MGLRSQRGGSYLLAVVVTVSDDTTAVLPNLFARELNCDCDSVVRANDEANIEKSAAPVPTMTSRWLAKSSLSLAVRQRSSGSSSSSPTDVGDSHLLAAENHTGF
jgi:hypothetical protein